MTKASESNAEDKQSPDELLTDLAGKWLAEREGFEPSVRGKPDNCLAGSPVQPLQHLSAGRPSAHSTPGQDDVPPGARTGSLAEGVGFEPTRGLPLAVFKTAAFDHSAIPPAIQSLDFVALRSTGSSSPLACISRTISHPPMNSPPT